MITACGMWSAWTCSSNAATSTGGPAARSACQVASITAGSASSIRFDVISARTRRSRLKSASSRGTCDHICSSSVLPTTPGPTTPIETVCGDR